MKKKKYYSVLNGRNTGIFESWEECRSEVIGYKNAVYKSFENVEDARKFMMNDFSDEKHTNEDIEERIKSLQDCEMIAFIDGSYSNKEKIYSLGAIIFTKDEKIEYKKAYNDEFCRMRNVAGEIKSAFYVMKYARKNNIRKLDIYYDYSGLENWAISNWKTNNKLTKAYKELYNEVSKTVSISFHKIKSHSDNEYNDAADKLAKEAIKSYIRTQQ